MTNPDGYYSEDLSDLKCPLCGAPTNIISAENPHMTWYTDITLDEEGKVEEVETRSAWCGKCLKQWEEKVE